MLARPKDGLGTEGTACLPEWLTALADIFERMADCREPVEGQEHERHATERALQAKYNDKPIGRIPGAPLPRKSP